MKQFFKQHAIGLCISIIIGAIIAAPPIIFQLSEAYQGFPMMKTNTETHYTTQVKEVYDGHYSIGNPFFADLKNTPYLFPPLGPHLYAWIGKLLGLGIVENIMVLRFLFTSTMAFFIYLFTAALTKNKFSGYVAAPFVMLGYSLIDPGHIATIIRERGIPAHAGFIDYGRPVNPQVSSLFFFGYLYFFWKALHDTSKKWWKFGIPSAIILGLSFYVYLFTWTFIFSLNGFLVLVSAIKKDWTAVRKIVAVSAGGALLGVPYFLHTIEVSRHPWYAETAPRFGFVRMREPQVSRLMLGIALVFLAFRKLFDEAPRRFFFAFLLTAFFLANEQVLTGIYVYNHHYHWYYATPLAIIMLSTLFVRLASSVVRERRYQEIVCVAAILILLSYGAVNQAYAYDRVLPEVKEEQRYAPLIRWLNSDTEKDSVVFAHHLITNVIVALTHNNVNYNGTVIYTLVPDERLFHEYLLYTYLDGVPTTSAREYFESQRNEISGFVYGYTYSFIPGVCYGCFPDTVIDELTARYEQFTDEHFLAALAKYPVDYLVWDKQKQPSWRLERFGLPVAATFGDIVVYDVRASASAQSQTYYPEDESGGMLCSAGYCAPGPTRASKMDSRES